MISTTRYDAVAIVACAGGVGGLQMILGDLPPGFPAPVLCLQPAGFGQQVLEMLQARCRLQVKWAQIGARPEPGCVHLSPPGTTMILRPEGTFSLTPFGTESESLRPADLFLQSVANVYGGRAMAVFLSGWGVDGLGGGTAIKSRGGRLLVRDHADMLYLDPVDAVIKQGLADRVLSVDEIGLALKIALHSPRIVPPAELREAVNPLLEEAVAAQSSDCAAIHLRDRGANSFQLLASHQCDEEFGWYLRNLDGEPWNRSARHGQRLVLPDVANEPTYFEGPLPANIRAIHATPIKAGEQGVVGMLSTIFERPRPLLAGEGENLDRLARDAGEALRKLLPA